MSLPYFFVPDISGNQVMLPEDTAKHCVQVLRMKAGEQLLLTDGVGHLHTATIKRAEKKQCTVDINETVFEERKIRRVSIAISPLKNTGRFEWFIEKATEIGVCEIIPLICHRTERQYFKAERMRNILIAAMLQSRQTWLPELKEPQIFSATVSQSLWENKLIAHCEELQKSSIGEYNNASAVQILIGPEGDFTLEEIESATSYGYRQVSLGLTRLRTETAGIVAASLLINGQ